MSKITSFKGLRKAVENAFGGAFAREDVMLALEQFEAGVRERELTNKEIGFIADSIWIESDELRRPYYGLTIDETKKLYRKLGRNIKLRRVLGEGRDDDVAI